MSALLGRFWMPAAAIAALAYLAVMTISGALPERRHLVKSEAAGVLELAPERITRVTISADGAEAVFVREATGWARAEGATTLASPAAATLERAVKFMHTAKPVRVLTPDEVAGTEVAAFGLDPPALSVQLEDAGGLVLAADFGGSSTDGLLRYMRLRDRPELYLVSGFVGREWDAVARMARP